MYERIAYRRLHKTNLLSLVYFFNIWDNRLNYVLPFADVFHWACLDRFSRQLPPTTAPAGYTCPSCRTCLFPASNLVSPVADVLREKLAGVNWARAGLGLPLVSYINLFS